MTDESVAGTRPRFFPTDEEKCKIAKLFRRLADDLDNPRGTLMNPAELPRILQAIRENRVLVIPPAVPFSVPYVQDEWSDLNQVSIKALNLSVALTNLLHREGITTVSQLLSTPEAEIFGEHKPKNLGAKSIESIQRALANQGLELISDPAKISFEEASRKAMEHQGLIKLGVYDIWADDIPAMAAKFGIVTLMDLVALKVSIDDVSNELLGGDHEYSCSGGWRSPDPDDPGTPPLVERCAKSIVIVFNAILSRYGLPALQL